MDYGIWVRSGNSNNVISNNIITRVPIAIKKDDGANLFVDTVASGTDRSMVISSTGTTLFWLCDQVGRHTQQVSLRYRTAQMLHSFQ